MAPRSLAAAAAALVGGLVWAGVVIATRMDIGFLALGIGAATGFAVARIAGSSVRTVDRLVAGVLATGGIVVGARQLAPRPRCRRQLPHRGRPVAAPTPEQLTFVPAQPLN